MFRIKMLFVKCILLLTMFHLISCELPKEFDFIIVGGGTAGAALAARLSENPKFSILVLEAGDAPPDLTEVPLLWRLLLSGAFDWDYSVFEQKYAFQCSTNKRPAYPRGKALGGSSAIHGMMYIRGNKVDYDLWAAGGATGWSYEEVLRYFKKSEGNRIKSPIDKGFHNNLGPVTVETSTYKSPYLDSIMAAFKQNGYPFSDVNGKEQRGFTETPLNIRDGLRCGSYKAYLIPALKRKNVVVITEAFVTKVKFNQQKKATGVYVDFKNSTSQFFKASLEVILSAGTINTPQILLLSGVGPKTHLDEMKIELVEDLPVGENFFDHFYGGGMAYNLTSDSVPISIQLQQSYLGKYISETNFTYSDSFKQAEIKDPLTGYLTSNLVQVIGHIKTDYEKTPGDYNDVQINVVEQLPFTALNIEPECKSAFTPYKSSNIISFYPVLLHPRTKGNVTLRSNNPRDSPNINYQYMEDPIEEKILLEGYRLIKKIIGSDSMKKFNPRRVGPLQGCQQYELESDDYLICQDKLIGLIGLHGVGTCRMGAFDDPKTVVDNQLLVKGLNGLRVVDASIMPYIPSGNTFAPTVMIAEKAADLIKEKYLIRRP